MCCTPTQERLPAQVRTRRHPRTGSLSRRHDLAHSSAIDFTPGELLGCVPGELGLRKHLEDSGHTLVVTSDKEGDNSTFEKELINADIVISQPFWPP